MHHQQHFIGGQWVAAQRPDAFDVHDSSTGEVFARVPAGTIDEANLAVVAAASAFEEWSRTPVAQRAALLERVATGLQARSEELAHLIAREVGMPIKLARAVQVGGPIWQWAHHAQLARACAWEEVVPRPQGQGRSLVVREPVGLVAAITPWNFPLNQITLKVAPALAAGCTVVLKPSEVAPLNAIVLAEVLHDAGLPPGVFNLVHGDGPTVGEALASHPAVDMVSFTGSTRAGRRVAELAAATVKRVALELGGKSASIVLPDADMPAAVRGTVSACLLNSGQTCSAHTRMLVPHARLDEVRALLREALARYVPGPSRSDDSRLGPLVSSRQRERVQQLVAQGVAHGAQLLAGGDPLPPGLQGGYFVSPAAYWVQPDNPLAQEEVFGPILAVLTYHDEAEAVQLANAGIYGLGGGVWSADDARALAVARRLRTGQVDINGAPFNPAAPFGGYKQSGNGRENGVYGLAEYLEYKSIQLRG